MSLHVFLSCPKTTCYAMKFGLSNKNGTMCINFDQQNAFYSGQNVKTEDDSSRKNRLSHFWWLCISIISHNNIFYAWISLSVT